jgi:rRNA maturation RNase YbeY
MALLLDLSSSTSCLFSPETLHSITESFEATFPALKKHTYTIEAMTVSRDKIQELNTEHRHKATATDVLSFPLFTEKTWPKEPQDTILGTIVICPDYAAEQKTPLLELLHHGILHILGYDHETDLVTWNQKEHTVITQAASRGLSIHGIPY